MGKIILKAGATKRWSPLDIPNLVAYVDPRIGVTIDGSDRVTAVVEQVENDTMTCAFTNPANYGGVGVGNNTPWMMTLDPNAFGTGIAGFHCAPDRSLVKAQFVRTDAPRSLPSGLSIFWVSKHTVSRSSPNHGENIPLTVTGESSHDIWVSCGFSGTALAYNYVDTDPSPGWSRPTFGSGFNDGTPRLYGFTHSLSNEVKAYANGSQVGSTFTGADYSTAHFTWCAVGTGYAVDAPPDIYGGDDGFAGDIGPVIVVGGIISSDDATKLYAWCQSAGYVP